MINRNQLVVWKKYFDSNYIKYNEDSYDAQMQMTTMERKFKTSRYPYLVVNQMTTKVLAEPPKITVDSKDVDEFKDLELQESLAATLGYGEIVVIPYMVESKFYYDVLPSCDTDYVTQDGELKQLTYLRNRSVYDQKNKEWQDVILLCEHKIINDRYYYFEDGNQIAEYQKNVMAPFIVRNRNLMNEGVPIYGTATGIIQDLNINDLYKKIDREVSKKEVLIPSHMVAPQNRKDEGVKQPRNKDADGETKQSSRRQAKPGNSKGRMGYVRNSRLFRMMPGIPGEKQQPLFIDGEFKPEKYIADANQSLHLLGMQCGFGAKYFSYDQASSGVKTATEVISDKSDLYNSKKMHDKTLKLIIEHLYRAVLIFTKEDLNKADKLEIQFNDNIIRDDESIKQDYKTLFEMGVIGQSTLLKQYGFTEQEIADELANTNIEEVGLEG